MFRYSFYWVLGVIAVSGFAKAEPGWAKPAVEAVAPGVWRVRFGQVEAFTPVAARVGAVRTRELQQLPGSTVPFALEEIRCRVTPSRTTVYVPCLDTDEMIYGFGLDPGAYQQRGLRKYLSVCATVMGKTGASHGPVPFYVSTKGYGVYVDTARVATVHVARLNPKNPKGNAPSSEQAGELKTSTEELYSARRTGGEKDIVFELPGNSRGVDVYVFGGPTLREAVQRYNLFSGGGAMPPMWGLGLKYRTFTRADQKLVLQHAQSLREKNIPCDGIGLEPGWQSRAYSCSLVWSPVRFPKSGEMIKSLNDSGYKINLWEHGYIHPESPLFGPLKSRSGDYLVWRGLVVDFADPEASRIFADYHDREFVSKGILGFKNDECDNQPVTDVTPFNYPYCSEFPSGIDGDQMTQLYGYYQQKALFSVFKKHNLRTWGDVRATTAMAAPLPFNLYSDAYEFDEYLRQLVNASFAGLLWSPEVRRANSLDEFYNRTVLSAFAPQMCLDLWNMPHPLWSQYDAAKNKAGELLPREEQDAIASRLREIINLRYEFLPYLYAAFYRYHAEGIPPVRSMLLDFPADKNLRNVDDQFMFGDSILVAPFVGETSERKVILPKGVAWYDFKTGQRHAGGTTVTAKGAPGDIPLYVKENSLIPLAKPVQYIDKKTVFDLTVKIFGQNPAPLTLIEDDWETFDFEKGVLNRVTLSWTERDGGTVNRTGTFPNHRYQINKWEPVAPGAAAQTQTQPAPDPLDTLRAGHPRLVFTPQDWAAFERRVKNRAQDPQFDALLSLLEKDARAILTAPALEHKKTGYRLLAVSREALRRVTTLAVVHRATRDEAFARRAEKEMLTAAAFADWNPSHFLDVAEMTAALALGYDWLHDSLPPESRAAIRRAIVEKGINAGIDPARPRPPNWHTIVNNWNQVCWGGLTLGALAIADDEPQPARATLALARANIVHGLKPYAPDGVYPEGPTYWNYGTSYQVVMIAALESALGTDWDLTRSPGFMESAKVQLHLAGPTGCVFNFSDCRNARLYDPALYWFARKLNTPTMATPPDASTEANRFLPLVALWWPANGLPAANTAPDLPLAWKGEGINPVAVFRSSWTDPNAMWLAVKAGAANASHGHMDAGSFIFEADGVRWAIDLGMQDYESLESKGLKIFGRTQDAQRWTIFRLNNLSHNTLTIGGQPHRVDGRAEFKDFWHDQFAPGIDGSYNGVTIDLSPVFAGQAASVERQFQFYPKTRDIHIVDTIEGAAPGTEIRWAMVTKAQVQFYDDNDKYGREHGRTALLTLNGKKLAVHARVGSGNAVKPGEYNGANVVTTDLSPINANDENHAFEVIPADPPKNDYDEPNPDTRILIVRTKANADGKATISVQLCAGETARCYQRRR